MMYIERGHMIYTEREHMIHTEREHMICREREHTLHIVNTLYVPHLSPSYTPLWPHEHHLTAVFAFLNLAAHLQRQDTSKKPKAVPYHIYYSQSLCTHWIEDDLFS